MPIIASEKVEREFGTGALKITPGHDPTDFEIGQSAGLQIINIMSNDASLNENAGQYAGLDRVAARPRIWNDLQVSLACDRPLARLSAVAVVTPDQNTKPLCVEHPQLTSCLHSCLRHPSTAMERCNASGALSY